MVMELDTHEWSYYKLKSLTFPEFENFIRKIKEKKDIEIGKVIEKRGKLALGFPFGNPTVFELGNRTFNDLLVPDRRANVEKGEFVLVDMNTSRWRQIGKRAGGAGIYVVPVIKFPQLKKILTEIEKAILNKHVKEYLPLKIETDLRFKEPDIYEKYKNDKEKLQRIIRERVLKELEFDKKYLKEYARKHALQWVNYVLKN